MDAEFRHSRNTIYVNEAERNRFRQVIVRAVVSTDIFDPTMAESRKERFEQAYESEETTPKSFMNCITFENLIQASDISLPLGPRCRSVPAISGLYIPANTGRSRTLHL